MKEKRVNVEYAHIYADKEFSFEQLESIIQLQKYLSKVSRKNVALSVLIDEYNPKYIHFDETQYLLSLLQHNARPDFVGYESRLVQFKDILFQRLSKHDARGIIKFEHARGKVPCSMLIALWNLLRLGFFGSEKQVVKRLSNVNFVAEEVINILPKKYIEVENKALRYLRESKLSSYINRIHHIYF